MKLFFECACHGDRLGNGMEFGGYQLREIDTGSGIVTGMLHTKFVMNN